MSNQKDCLVCGRNQQEIPVTEWYYQESSFFICAQHIPVLIHDPQKLIGLLPNAEKMEGA